MVKKGEGMRVYWDGQKMLDKFDEEILLPLSLCEGLPKIPLDIELNSISKTQDMKNVTMTVLDWVQLDQTFESRLQRLKKLSLPPYVQLAHFQVCKGQDHLKQFVHETLNCGNNSVFLKEPRSFYVQGKTSALQIIEVICICQW